MTSLTNLLALCGGDNVIFQPLDAAIMDYKAASSRNPARLTFGTDVHVGVSLGNGGAQIRTEKLGLLIWLDRDKVEKGLKVASPAGVDPEAYRPLLTLQLALLDAQKARLRDEDREGINALLEHLEARLGKISPF